MIHAVIIDDEQHSRELLQHFLSKYCENVLIKGEAGDVTSGIDLIKTVKPQVVFLDIEIPGGSGFDIVATFPDPDFEIVFVTGYNARTIRALNGSALEYLEKPVEIGQLREVLSRIHAPGLQADTRLEHLAQSMENEGEAATHVVLPLGNSYLRVALDEILYLEASGGYVRLHLMDGRSCLASRPMKHFESFLPRNLFFRIHKSYIVNCAAVTGFDTGRAGDVFLEGNIQLPIAFRRKSALVDRLRTGN